MILPAHTARQLRNASLSALYRVAYDHDVDFSDVMASITPSQPIPQAPAARTSPVPVAVQAEETPNSSAINSDAFDPPPMDGTTHHRGAAIAEPSIPEAPKPLPDEEHRPAEAKTSDQGALSSEPGEVQDRCASTSPTPSPPPGDPADGAVIPPNRDPAPSAAFSPKRVTQRQRVRECHEANPTWTASQIAAELGMGTQHVRVIAGHISLKLPSDPRPAPESMQDKVTAVFNAHPDWGTRQIAEAAGCSHVTAARWVKEARGRPQAPVEPAAAPTPPPERKQPPAAIPAEPFDDDEPAPRVRKVTKAPTGRFYLRERDGEKRYVHQSLQQSPTRLGPMMTSDRKWAWYDTMERYRGAKKLWPEIADMRKEAASA